MPFHEGEFEYLSTFHWRPMVNGYSGNWTTRHIEFLEALRGFPDARSIDTLHAAGVSYVILHERYMGPSKYHSILQQLESATTLKRAETFSSDGDEVAVYEPQAPGENGVRRADAERSRQ